MGQVVECLASECDTQSSNQSQVVGCKPYVTCWKMDRSDVKQNKPDSEKQVLHVFGPI
jgi:hypothetical protein